MTINMERSKAIPSESVFLENVSYMFPKISKRKAIILIPPNGKIKRQDYTLERLARSFREIDNISSTLLYIPDPSLPVDLSFFDRVIAVANRHELFEQLNLIEHDVIIHRSWMHAYPFAAELAKNYENVIVNIKDWNFAPEDVYRFLFNDDGCFEAIADIFHYSRKVLSHFTNEQALLWSKEYNVPTEKFLFFPEYCNTAHFIRKTVPSFVPLKLVYAGRIAPTHLPEAYFPFKAHLRSIQKLTAQNICIDFVLPEHEYNHVQTHRKEFQDFLYEDRFNDRFNLIQGKSLDPNVLQPYHFGFFELEASGKNHLLYKYAVISKFAFYMEAGIPILVNEKFVSIAELVKKHGLGIVFCNRDLDDFAAVTKISEEEYNRFLSNVDAFRQNYTYTAERVAEAFFEPLAQADSL